MTCEKIEEAGDPIGPWSAKGEVWECCLKGNMIRHTFSPIQLDATDLLNLLLLWNALLIHQLLPHQAGRSHIRHGYHHKAS